MSPVKFTNPGVSALWTPEGNELSITSAWCRIVETGLKKVRPSCGAPIHHHFQIDLCQSPVSRSMNRQRRNACASTQFRLSLSRARKRSSELWNSALSARAGRVARNPALPPYDFLNCPSSESSGSHASFRFARKSPIAPAMSSTTSADEG